jgi:hypothetical protein
MMRWIYFLILTLAAIILQTTLVQLLWVRTPIGPVGPELLAAVAVFVALRVRGATEAALAGWALGLAVDLTLSGPGMGLLPLLYAAAAAGINRLREAVFGGRAMTQIVLTFLFCTFVYETWAFYDLWQGEAGGRRAGATALLALGLSAYTGLLAPLVCRLLRRLERLLLATPPGRARR